MDTEETDFQDEDDPMNGLDVWGESVSEDDEDEESFVRLHDNY